MKKFFLLAVVAVLSLSQCVAQSSIDFACESCKVSGLYRYFENNDEFPVVSAKIIINGKKNEVVVKIPEKKVKLRLGIDAVVSVDNNDCSGDVMFLTDGSLLFVGLCDGYPATYVVFGENRKIVSKYDKFNVKRR